MTITNAQLDLLVDRSALVQICNHIAQGQFCALHGAPYSGKTHLLRAIRRELMSDGTRLVVLTDARKLMPARALVPYEQGLSHFFGLLSRDILSQAGSANPLSPREYSGAELVRCVIELTELNLQHGGIVWLIDHFEAIPRPWGHALLGALRAVYEQRTEPGSYARRINAVVSSSVSLFEASLGKTSPLSIARSVTTGDLTLQQMSAFLKNLSEAKSLGVTDYDIKRVAERTCGHRYLTLAFCEQWIQLSAGTGILAPIELVEDRLLTLPSSDDGLRSTLEGIEADVDVVVQLWDLLQGKTVKRRELLAGPSRLELTGVVRLVEDGFMVHNPLLDKILRRWLSAERVIYLLGNGEHPDITLDFLRTQLDRASLASYHQVYLKAVADIIVRERNDIVADEYLLDALLQVFNVAEAYIFHIGTEQSLTRPADFELPDQLRNTLLYALAERRRIILGEDPATVVIPFPTQGGLCQDALLIRNYGESMRRSADKEGLNEIERFSKAVIQNRLKHLRAQRLDILQALTRSMRASTEQRSMLQQIVDSANGLFSADSAVLCLGDITGQSFSQTYMSGAPDVPNTLLFEARQLALSVLESGRPTTIARGQQSTVTKRTNSRSMENPQELPDSSDHVVIRGYPIHVGGACAGVLMIGYRWEHFVRPFEDEMAQTILEEVAVGLRRNSLGRGRELRQYNRVKGRRFPEGQPILDKMKRILHLSDIHLETKSEAMQYRIGVETDLAKELELTRLDYIVVAGDLANKCTREEYDAALELIGGLANRFELAVGQVLVVPGNHDLNWALSRAAYRFLYNDQLGDTQPAGRFIPAGEEGVLMVDDMSYRDRFGLFSDCFYQPMFGGAPYPLDYGMQAILSEYSDDSLLFLSLNSAWEIDHHFRNRASINMEALTRALDQLHDGQYDNWLKIAVFHHPVTGREAMNDDFMELLAVHGFQIVLHGHVHEAREGFYKYDDKRGIHIIGAGTFGAPTREQVPGIPLQYNLLTFDPATRKLTVETRKKEKPDGAWMADARWGDKNNPSPRYTIQLR